MERVKKILLLLLMCASCGCVDASRYNELVEQVCRPGGRPPSPEFFFDAIRDSSLNRDQFTACVAAHTQMILDESSRATPAQMRAAQK